MNNVLSYGVALLFALLFHGLVIALMSYNWEQSSLHVSDITPYYIEAAVVRENPYRARERQEKDRQRQKLQQTLNQRRLDERKLAQQQAEWEKQRAEARKVVPEPEPVVIESPPAEEKIDQPEVDPESIRSEFEESLARALVQEQNARKAVTDDEKAMAYVAQIQSDIIRNWSRPPSARNGMEALLRVFLVPTGEVVDVKVIDSSGNDAFDRSALLAVRKAGRFEVPVDSRRFERDFREFTVIFKPEDLRL
jgi:colicin import membrane protein